MSEKTIKKNGKSLKLPKNVHIKGKKYFVDVYNRKTSNNHYVGIFDTIEEAIIARDKYVVENYDLLGGYVPRGISFNKLINKYVAFFCFGKEQVNLGSFKSLKEAVEYRNKYIDSLK